MNINSSKFNLSFQKQLVAKATVLKNNEQCPVSVYKLDKKEDKDYFENLSQDKKWQGSKLLKYVVEQFPKQTRLKFTHGYKLKFYTLEDKEKNCLGYMQVNDARLNVQNLQYIESQPANKKTKEYKYLGETMLAFLAKQQQAKKWAKQLYIPTPLFDAREFYYKEGFESACDSLHPLKMFLPLGEEENLIARNEVHTQSEIELVGQNENK